MTDLKAPDRDTRSPCLTSVDTLVAHAIAAREHVHVITDAWTTTYDAGDCSARQIVAALYACHQPLAEAITLLEQAKQGCCQAMEPSLCTLNALVELPSQGTLRWVAPTSTGSYAPKTVAAISADLHADLLLLLPSLDTLGTLLPLLSAAQEKGALSASDTEALVTTINDLACGCRAAQDADRRLSDARTEGSRADYVKVEVDRSPSTPVTDSFE